MIHACSVLNLTARILCLCCLYSKCINEMVTFAIVEFTKDLTVEVVPSNWIVDNTCLWPPLRGLRFTAAAKKCETPTHLWKKYPIRVMGTYGWLHLFLFKHVLFKLFHCIM